MLGSRLRWFITLTASFTLFACGALLPKNGARSGSSGEPASVAVIIKGSKSARVRSTVETMLGDRYDLVSNRLYKKTAKRLRARKMKAAHVARVSESLGIDAVIQATLQRKSKKRYRLIVRVRDGETGKTIDKFTLSLRSRKLRGDDREALAGKLFPRLDALGIPAEDDVDSRTMIASRSDAEDDEDDEDDGDAGDERDRRDERVADEPEARTAAAPARAKRSARAEKPAKAEKPVRAEKAARSSEPVKASKPARKPARSSEPVIEDDDTTEKVETFEPLRYDDEGQVIDDEVPTSLKKR